MLDKSTEQRNDVMVSLFVFPFLARTILQETSTETDDKTIKKSTVVDLLTIIFFLKKRQVIFTSDDNKFSRVNVIKRTENFRSSKTLLFRTKATRKTFLVKMRFLRMRRNNHFHINGFTFSLALKERLGATRK